MSNKAYLAGAINSALVLRDDGFHLLNGATGLSEKLDGYLFSQLRAIRPELKEFKYINDAELTEQLHIESIQQEALQEALELMDGTLSEKYRLAVAEFLIDKTKIYSGLIDFLTNRLYSNSLPDEFNEVLAIKVLTNGSEMLLQLYENLRSKTEMFDRFYTVFEIKANCLVEDQEVLNELLTESSAFAHFTLALYSHSTTIYDYAVSIALKIAESHHYYFMDKRFFSDLKEEIRSRYQIMFNAPVPLERLLVAGKMINVKPYNFFGSPLRTIYNYYNHHLPFTVEETVQVLFQTHSPYKIPHESHHEYEQRLYVQSINDFSFLADLGQTYPLITHTKWQQPEGIKNQLSSVNNWYMKTDRNGYAPVVRQENYAALLYADCTFLNRDFNDAVILYSDLKSDFIKRKSTDHYFHIVVYCLLSIRLAKTFEMLDEEKMAINLYRDVHRKLSSYFSKHMAKAEIIMDSDEDKDGEISFCPSHLDYVESMAERVAGLFVHRTTTQKRIHATKKHLSNLNAHSISVSLRKKRKL